jgi:peptide methionine sulfoxide reductase msrA/msrB
MRPTILAAIVLTLFAPLAARAQTLESLLKMTTTTQTPRYSRSAYDLTPLSAARVEELAAGLTEEEKRILLRKGTEPAFCGNLLDNRKEGLYLCRLCSLPLFSSAAKFNSGTGWPSFFQPFDRDHIRYERDTSHGMTRVEILCARCGGHLGHVFDDAPQTPTGLRYCLNSASLVFVGRNDPLPEAAQPLPTRTAYFAGGCFWGIEDRFQQTLGVINAESGYMGGTVPNPTYRQVCTGQTGHAETVRVTYDPSRITYEQLLEAFFRYHDPTQLNRQGPDVGTQYRSAIFAADEEQLRAARAFVQSQRDNPRYKGRSIVTEVVGPHQAGTFYPAEDYHQDYHEKHGGHCPVPADP